MIKILAGAAMILCGLNASQTLATPVQYSFTTGQPVSIFAPGGVLFAPSAFTLFGGASGTFDYDSQAPLVGVFTGVSAYGAFTPGGLAPTISNLSGIAGNSYTFSDPNGAANVANDTFTGFGSLPNVDALTLVADPVGGSPTTPRNIIGFELDNFRLISVRMLWIETLDETTTFGVPGTGPLTPDFLADQNLPAAPPAFAGRLWLDFQDIDNPNITGFAYYNNLMVTPLAAVPEPETYVMLFAGLGLLGWQARRRKQVQSAA